MSAVIIFGGAALFFVGVPVAIALGLFCFAYLLQSHGDVAFRLIPQQIFTGIDSFLLVAVPMFLLTGELMTRSKLTERLMEFSSALVGWLRGGVAQVNLMTNLLMSGISGSALADAAATGSVMVPMMTKAGYSAGFSAALTACASCLGPIIPPSIIMVLISGLTSISVGRMFLGGVVPGLLLAIGFSIVIFFKAPKQLERERQPWSPRDLANSFVRALPALGLPTIIAGGILSGLFTPTEASAVAVLYTLVVGFAARSLTWKDCVECVITCGIATGALMLVVGASAAVGWILIEAQAGDAIAAFLQGIADSPAHALGLIVLALAVLGCVLEVVAILVLAVPMLLPVATAFGIDPVHFGVVATVALTTGLVTPPFGLSMFLMARMANVSMGAFVRNAWPFYLAMFVVLALMVWLPGTVTWLPNLVLGDKPGI